MKLIDETVGADPGRYYYMIRRRYLLDDGRVITGCAGFDGGKSPGPGHPEHDAAVAKARADAEADAFEQLGDGDGRR